MKRIGIGIHFYSGLKWLQATLVSLQTNTTQAVEMLLLPDGTDATTKNTLATLRELPQWVTEKRLGPAACFNRLAIATDADVLVFLESGSLVGTGWLDYLLAALAADSSNGIAGPSTNRAENEQCVFPRSGCHSFAEVSRTAEAAVQRFGRTWHLLKPPHSLADFCLVVRREVLEAMGVADEGYGTSAYWVMDYSTRAARAGFQTVWAGGAYVYRGPSTAPRQRGKAELMVADKKRYQEKFSTLLGDEPKESELPGGRETEEQIVLSGLNQFKLPLPVAQGLVIQASMNSPREILPLVSCIMPTRNRPDYVLQSIRYFQQQDYPNRELIVVYDSKADLPQSLPDDSNLRYLQLSQRKSIGYKRNRACELARGSIIAQWDDDDWFAPNRLQAQIKPLLEGTADISGITDIIFFDLTHWKFWKCTPSLHRRLFIEDVAAGTLVYRRHLWEQFARYPNISLREDATFMCQVMQRGARLYRVPNEGLFMYLRHGSNSWSFTLGQYPEPQGWQQLAEPKWPEADRSFYAAHSPAAPIVASISCFEQGAPPQPLVSCIMPTADRHTFVPQAIRYFLRQDYGNRELIVVDDGTDSVADLIPSDTRIRYIRMDRKHTVGAKRNLACQEARGEIIVHWDDDDWMAPGWLSYLVTSLLKEQADICGLDRVLFYDLRCDQAWEYIYPRGSKAWVCGGTLCYRKAFWQRHPFAEINVGEDSRFVWNGNSNKIVALPDNKLYVALIHHGNTSPKVTSDRRWHPYDTQAVRELLVRDWTFYADFWQKQNKELKLCL